MTRTEIEQTLALQWAGVPEIPAEADESTPVWIYAIAKVQLRSMRESWVIAKMNYGKSPMIVKSFCDSGIAEIVSIHPYKFLDTRYVPKFQNGGETKQYIASAYGVPFNEVMNLKKPELLRLFYEHCIKTQLEDEKNQSLKLNM